MEYNNYNKSTNKNYFNFPKIKTKNKNRGNFINFGKKNSKGDEIIFKQKKDSKQGFLSESAQIPFLNSFFQAYSNFKKTFLGSSSIYEDMKKRLNNIPENKNERKEFIADFFETDLKTGKKNARDNNLVFEEYIKTLVEYDNKDLKTMLNFYVDLAETYKDSNYDIVFNMLMQYKPYTCQSATEKDVLGLVKKMHKMYPNKRYISPSDVYRFSCLSDAEYKKASNLTNKIYFKNDTTQLNELIAFASKTPEDTIEYMLQNDLFNLENLSGFSWNITIKNMTKLFYNFGGLKKDTVETMHKRGLLKEIPERGGYGFSFDDVKNMALYISDEDWENKVLKRNLLTAKTNENVRLDYSTIFYLANLTDEEFEKLDSRQLLSKVGFFTENIIPLLLLNEEDWQKVVDRKIDIGKINLSPKENDRLSKLLSISDEKWQIAQKRGFTFASNDDFELLELDDDCWDNVVKRNLNEEVFSNLRKYDIEAIIRLSKLSDEEYENAVKRNLIKEFRKYKESVFDEESEFLSKLTDKEYSKYITREVSIIAAPFEIKKKLFEISDEEFKKLLEEIFPKARRYDNQQPYSYYRLIYLDDEKYELAKQFLGVEYLQNNQFDIDEIEKIIQLEPEKIERLKGLLFNNPIENSNKYFSKDSILKLLEFSSEQYGKIMDSVDFFTEFQFNRFIKNDIMLKICNSDSFNENKELLSKINNSQLLDCDTKNELTNILLEIDNDYSKINLQEKIKLIKMLQNVQNGDVFTEEEKQVLDINNTISKIQESIQKVIAPTQTTKEQTSISMKGFFANNNPELHYTLSKANFEQYKKEGLPLSYSRKEFLKDLSKILNATDKKTKKEILNKLSITPIEDEQGNITGYNGIIDLTKLSQNPIEKEVFSIANKFIKENKITTGDKNLDNAMNSLISGIPEFINTIGKQQHQTHDFSLDIHILTVLKEALNNPKYKNLSNIEKFCLKFAIILHDIAKAEGIVDHGHEDLSALYARDILNKSSMVLPTEIKNRIYEMIKNHHWLANYNKGHITADETAVLFRRNGDLKIARIMAEADLKGVDKNNNFYKAFKKALEYPMQHPIEETLDKINTNGQIFLTNKIVNSAKIPKLKYNGDIYKVIDFTRLPNDFDLFEYGFEKGATKKNFRLLVHVVSDNNISNLENIYHLSDASNQGFICASFISAKEHPTYCDYRFGVSLEAENVNIANAAPYNQTSGNKKKYSQFAEIITNPNTINSPRKLIPRIIKGTLSIDNEEYIELYKKIQKYKFFSQLDNQDIIKIGDKTFTSKQIKEAILMANERILEYSIKYGYEHHNEVNLYIPKTNAVIAKVNSIEEIPDELLDFALKHDLPIYILGE